jgi:hypothetical protein
LRQRSRISPDRLTLSIIESLSTASDLEPGSDGRSVAVSVYLRLLDAESAEIVAVLARDDNAIVAVPRIGEDYVTAARYGVRVTGVEHDTTAGEQQVTVFLDEKAIDPNPLIDLHVESGWVLVRDERQQEGARRG